MQRMNSLDAAFLYFETPKMPMHVLGVLVLEPTGHSGEIRTADIARTLEERLHLIRPLRRRVVFPPGAFEHPVWIEDPDFDLDRHVRRAPLPPGAGWDDLEAFAAGVAAQLLDRSRPLWEMWVVEEMEGGSVALVTKLHHCLMDGGAGGDLMASIFDLEPDAPPFGRPEEEWEPEPVPSPAALAVSSLAALGSRMTREAPLALLDSLRHIGGAGVAWARQRLGGSGARLAAPRTMLNGPLTRARSVSLSTLDLDDVREIRRAFGTTINDVVLAVVGTALRGYLADRGTVPDRPLVMASPVNARAGAPGPDGSGELGNRVSNMMVSVPLQPDDPVERLRALHDSAMAAKELHRALGSDTMQQLTRFGFPPVMTVLGRAYSGLGIAGLHRPVLNLIVSNVPGPPIDLYCAGAKVTGIFPMGPVAEGTGLNITVLSEARHLNVGIMACPDLVPDVGEIARRMAEAVAELRSRAAASAA